VTAAAFPNLGVEVPWAACRLEASGSSAGSTTTTIAGDDAYAALGTQITVRAFSQALVSFTCSGDKPGVNEVTLTAIEVSRITDKSP
jgi:hypothetical protein